MSTIIYYRGGDPPQTLGGPKLKIKIIGGPQVQLASPSLIIGGAKYFPYIFTRTPGRPPPQ